MPEKYDLYLLVHPERWPSNDSSAILDELFERGGAGGFDAAYGRQVLAAAAQAKHTVVLLDPSDVEILAAYAAEGDLCAGAVAPELSLAQLQVLAGADGGEVLAVTEGAPLAAFELALEGDAYAVEEMVASLRPPHPGATVLLGGFARHDCVRRAKQTLNAGGWTVRLCARTVLPLNPQGFGAYLNDAVAVAN